MPLTDRIRTPPRIVLALLLAVNTLNFFDRQVLSAVTEPVRRDWGLSDTQIGLLGTSFTLLYALVGLPLGRLADLWSRKYLLAICLGLWSGLTYASGLCRGFWSLFAVRMGVGIGEAGCAPVCSSLIGDLFPPERRARALSVFMLGLPMGGALSFILSGTIAQHYGWRPAFFVAGLPGLALAVVTLFMHEPARGAAEAGNVGQARRPGPPYRLVLGIPTMRWIVASGAIHNFNMYALTAFLPAFLIRYHGASVQAAGLLSGLMIGALGGLGSLAGGWLGDAVTRRRAEGRMLLAAGAILVSAPAGCMALVQPPGAIAAFLFFLSISAVTAYMYYPVVYASIQDVIEPSLRGTAMAVYFFAMYLLGGAVGPLGAGWLSDHLAQRAAAGAGVAPGTMPLGEAYRAIGLHQAMFVVPILGLLLGAVLLAGCFTVRRDMEHLRSWIKQVPPPAMSLQRTPK